MQRLSRSYYELWSFTSSSDRDYADAIAMYSRNIPDHLRTDTNEIAYWVDNQKSYGENKLLFLGFYSLKKLVGFSEMVYIKSSKIMVIDYFVISPEYRKDNVYDEFLSHIDRYIYKSGLDVRYVVAEIGRDRDFYKPKGGKTLVRRLKMSGFKVAKASYFQPQLGEKNEESEIEAVLMIYPYASTDDEGEQKGIKKSTYLKIVNSIYFEHYLRWYSPHLSNIQLYEEKLRNTYNKLDNSISNKLIILNGHHPLLGLGAETTDQPDKTHITAGLGLLFVVSITFILLASLVFFNVPGAYLFFMLLFVLMAYVGIFAALKGSSLEVFKEVSQTFKKFFRI